MSVPQLSWRELKSHPGRTVLTALSVMIGVATMIAVVMATRATRHAYAELYETLTGKAELQVTATLGGSFDQQLYLPIQKVSGVEIAAPVIQRPTILLYDRKHLPETEPDSPPLARPRAQALVIGIDPQNRASTENYRVVAGEFFGKELGGAVLEKAFADQLGLTVGDEIKLRLSRVRIVGLVEPEKGAGFSQGLAFLTIAKAQQVFDIRKQLDTIYLHLAEKADVKKVQEEVARLLPDGVRVEPPPSRSELADESLNAMYQGLNLASSLSLVVAGFIIMNTFLMSVAERQKQMAILRAIGATRKQVMGLVLREGFWFGLTGSIVGVVLGISGAGLLTRLIGRMFGTSMPAPEFTLGICAAGIVAGLGISLLSSYFPARSAAKISPLSGMRDVISQDSDRQNPLWPILGATLLTISGTIILISALGHLPFWVTIPGVLVLLISLVLVLPVLFNPTARLLGIVLYPVLGFSGQLAQRQILRRRSRSILTMGVLFISTATGIGAGMTVLNDSQDVDRWFERSVGGDFFVRAMMLDMSTGQTADLPPELGAEINAVPGIEKLRTGRMVSTRSQDGSVIVQVREFPPEDPLYLDLRKGDEETLRERLPQGAVVIGTVLSQRMNLGVGDTIELDSEKGMQKFPIVGVANDYAAAGLIVYIEKGVAERELGIQGVDVYVIKADPQALSEVEKSLQKICRERGLLLQSYADLVKFVQGIKNGIIGSLWGLLVLGFIVATFGIANTLAMNVLEQTREIGLLRMIAMTRRQVRRMIVSQALLMGIIGLTPGLIAGVIMALISNYTTKAAFGHSSEFHWHPGLLIVVIISAALVILLAALLPALRASRLPPAAAIRHE